MWNSCIENHLHEFNPNRAGLRTVRHPAGLGGFRQEHPRSTCGLARGENMMLSPHRPLSTHMNIDGLITLRSRFGSTETSATAAWRTC
jgi:hypothetical protein